jgi:hypothetical protein
VPKQLVLVKKVLHVLNQIAPAPVLNGNSLMLIVQDRKMLLEFAVHCQELMFQQLQFAIKDFTNYRFPNCTRIANVLVQFFLL